MNKTFKLLTEYVAKEIKKARKRGVESNEPIEVNFSKFAKTKEDKEIIIAFCAYNDYIQDDPELYSETPFVYWV